jgi:hypothetical protein
MDTRAIYEFVDAMKFDKPISPEDFKIALKEAYKDRSRQIYFIWRKIKQLYPGVDANQIIREGSWDFGQYQGRKIAEKYGAENIGPKEALLGQTSKGGMLVFEQEIKELNSERAVKLFNACPHVEAIKELGGTLEEVKAFCRDMLGACDYGICAPFPNVEIDFPTTVADGCGQPCAMTITRKK